MKRDTNSTGRSGSKKRGGEGEGKGQGEEGGAWGQECWTARKNGGSVGNPA